MLGLLPCLPGVVLVRTGVQSRGLPQTAPSVITHAGGHGRPLRACSGVSHTQEAGVWLGAGAGGASAGPWQRAVLSPSSVEARFKCKTNDFEVSNFVACGVFTVWHKHPLCLLPEHSVRPEGDLGPLRVNPHPSPAPHIMGLCSVSKFT